MQGFTSWLMPAKTRPAPRGACGLSRHSLGEGGHAPAGKRPGAFPRAPFAARVKNASAYIAFFTFKRPAFSRRRMGCGNGFTRGLTARVHSAFFLTGKKKASLAPCALGGDRLATTVCEQTPLAVVLKRPANWRVPHFIFHLSSFIIKP